MSGLQIQSPEIAEPTEATSPEIDRLSEQRGLRDLSVQIPESLEKSLSSDERAQRNFDGLSASEKQQFLAVWSQIENQSGARTDLITLLNRDLDTGKPALISCAPGSDSLLDHLNALATDTSTIDIYAKNQDRILSGLIHECSNPANVVQGWIPSCVVTQEVCHPLVESNPAEYGRLVREQTLTGQMRLADGTVVKGQVDRESMQNQREIEVFAARIIDQYWSSKQLLLGDDQHTLIDFHGLTKKEATDLLISRIDNGREERAYSGRVIQDALLGENKWQGLLSTETESLIESAHATYAKRLDFWNGECSRGIVPAEVDYNLAARRRISATVLDESDGAHEVGLVSTFSRGGTEYVIIRDPRGAGNEIEKTSGPLPRSKELHDEFGEFRCEKDQWIVRMDVFARAVDRIYIDMGTGPDAAQYAGVKEPTRVPDRRELAAPDIDLRETKVQELPEFYRNLLDHLFLEQAAEVE